MAGIELNAIVLAAKATASFSQFHLLIVFTVPLGLGCRDLDSRCLLKPLDDLVLFSSHDFGSPSF